MDIYKDFVFRNEDLIKERAGKITQFYTLLNPPLGKGISLFIYCRHHI